MKLSKELNKNAGWILFSGPFVLPLLDFVLYFLRREGKKSPLVC